MSTVFVYADWSQLETWLTAHLANDENMLAVLEASLHGGPKIHAINAEVIYGAQGVTAANAKDVRVNLKGRMRPAYDGGKRAGHAFDYGMAPPKFASTYWTTLKFAQDALGGLARRYPAVVARRARLADEVFGAVRYRCPRCDHTTEGVGRSACPACRLPETRYDGWARLPEREHRTPFGRRRLYPGRRKEGANAVAAQDPQSCGASMWFRTLHRLNGFEVVDGVRSPWPRPPFPYRVATGTYDSFLLEAPSDHAPDVLSWLLWTMEQPWPQLQGRRFPAEGAIGWNWGEVDLRCFACGADGVEECACGAYEPSNLRGLEKVEYEAWGAGCPEGWRS